MPWSTAAGVVRVIEREPEPDVEQTATLRVRDRFGNVRAMLQLEPGERVEVDRVTIERRTA